MSNPGDYRGHFRAVEPRAPRALLILYAPVSCWLHLLAEGWRLPSPVVDVMRGHHGHYAVLLERDA